MRLKNLDLIVALIISAMNVAWALLPSHTPAIGIILALPLVFVLPGYTLTEAMFHKRALEASHRLLLSLGLSLAIDILGGLILNMLPAGLQARSWAVLLGLLTAVFSLLVGYLRRGTQLYGAQSARLRFTIYEFILFGLATTVAILSVQYSAISLAQQPHSGFTQLWMLPSVQVEKSCAVRLGVRSFEVTSVKYRVTMTINGTLAKTWSPVVLAPQDEWDQLVPLTSGTTDNMYVEVQLYRSDKPEIVYREVTLTLHLLSKSKDEKARQCG